MAAQLGIAGRKASDSRRSLHKLHSPVTKRVEPPPGLCLLPLGSLPGAPYPSVPPFPQLSSGRTQRRRKLQEVSMCQDLTGSFISTSG